MGGDSNDATYFPHRLLLTNTQFQGFVKLLQMAYQLHFSKTRLSKIGQLGRSLFSLVDPFGIINSVLKLTKDFFHELRDSKGSFEDARLIFLDKNLKSDFHWAQE